MVRSVPRLLASVATLVFLLAACGSGGSSSPGPSASPSPPLAAPSPTVAASSDPVVAIAPLTGEETTDLEVEERPVVAVKIENTAASRPQAGLDDADIVFEEVVEGGLTRFAAIFQSTVPKTVGPIRSGRPEDASVLPAFEPMLFISGARDEVIGMLQHAGIEFQDEDGAVLYRDRSRRAPHNVFASGESLFDVAGQRTGPARPMGWRFDEDPPAGAVRCPECDVDPGETITVSMTAATQTRFDYDRRAGLYRRFQDGAPQAVTGSGQVGAANVLVLATEIHQAGCCDTAGNPLYETQVIGEGRAIVLRDGKRYDLTWTKAGPSAHVSVLDAAGRPFEFSPGPTWVLLAPEAGVPDPGE